MKIQFLSVCLSSGRIRIVLASTLLLFVVFVAFLNVKANSATVVTSILRGNKLDTFEQTQTNDTGTIRGHVTASDGGSLEGLVITGEGNNHQVFATVDGSGNYEFIEVPIDTYRLLFGDRIFADNHLSYYIPEYYNNHLEFYLADYITVTANSVAVVDAELQLGAIITGTVISNETGEPLMGIKVTPHQVDGQTLLDDVTTDQNGQYELHGLPSGSYLLCFYDPGSAYPNQCLPELAVTAGESIQANMTLILGATVQGKVTSDQTGQGIPDVHIAMSENGRDCCWATTDNNGFYQITGLATGDYTIYFGTFASADPFVSEYYNNQPTVGDIISITAGTLITIDAGLSSSLNMIGEIVPSFDFTNTYSHPNIYVYDETGQGVGKIWWFGRNSSQFVVYELNPGSYRLAFASDQYGEKIYPEYYNDKLTFEDADPITVTQGAISNLVVTLTGRSDGAVQLATSAALTDVMLLKTFDSANRYASLRYSNNGGSVWQSLLSEPWITTVARPDFDFVATLVPRGNETFPTRIIRASKTSYSPANNSEIFRTGDFGASWATFEPAVLANCRPIYRHTYLDILNSPVDPVRIYMYAACFDFSPDSPLANSDKSATPTKETRSTAYYTEPRPQLFTSNNAGIDWQEVSFPQMFHIFPVGFIVSPILPNRIYVTGHIQGDAAHVALAQSDDAGVTWSTGVTLPVTYVEFDWHDSMKIYGIEDKNAFNYPLGSFGKLDVYRYKGKRSADGGATWVDWQEQPCRTSFQQFFALQQPNTLLMRCLQGLYRSSNGGDHWEKLPETVDELIAVDYGNRNRIFGQRQGLLYASLDQGSTWTALADWHSSMWLPFVSR